MASLMSLTGSVDKAGRKVALKSVLKIANLLVLGGGWCFLFLAQVLNQLRNNAKDSGE